MPSSWGVYYVVFLSALLSLCVPVALALIARWVGQERRGALSDPTPQPPRFSRLGQRVNIRFFLAINASLILIALVLSIVPCLGTLQSAAGDRAALFRGVVAIVSISGFASLGLLYASRKGDLSWMDTFQSSRNSRED